jgi:sterol desaturase/sphingolipid hydroxylase (fatty acid hydroxylase superfamily)
MAAAAGAGTLEQPDSIGRLFVRWGLYPLLWAINLGTFYLNWYMDSAPAKLASISVGFVFLLCFAAEFLYPYDKRWAMTWRSLWSDIKFAVPNGLTLRVLGFVFLYFGVSASGDLAGPADDWPLPVQLASCLLIFEGLNYGVHRAMHELPGRFGAWLWRVHAAHHLPPRLYLVMHAVFHPINALIIRGLVIVLPIWAMGYNQQVIALFGMIMALHGIISHFNVDMRMGWANYLFVGPELHRYHHSARPDEAKNYGATLSVFDQLFGTFVYRPGVPPRDLGVRPDSGLPDYDRTGAVLALPFCRP